MPLDHTHSTTMFADAGQRHERVADYGAYPNPPNVHIDSGDQYNEQEIKTSPKRRPSRRPHKMPSKTIRNLSAEEKGELERVFTTYADYSSPSRCDILAAKLGLNRMQIKRWFARRTALAQLESETINSSTSNSVSLPEPSSAPAGDMPWWVEDPEHYFDDFYKLPLRSRRFENREFTKTRMLFPRGEFLMCSQPMLPSGCVPCGHSHVSKDPHKTVTPRLHVDRRLLAEWQARPNSRPPTNDLYLSNISDTLLFNR